MLQEKLKNFNIILASASPRRHKFFKDLNINFEIRLNPIKEVHPAELRHAEISDYLARLKANPFLEALHAKDILITSDTIVWHENQALGKPRNNEEAFAMITSMSGKTHEVITSVCFSTMTKQITEHAITKVTFKSFSKEEINYYLSQFNVMDKAGAYGIQDWIGLVGVTSLEGSYFNVMGLPTHLVYKTLMAIADI